MLSQSSLAATLQQIDAQSAQDNLTLSQKFSLEKQEIDAQKSLLDIEKTETAKEISNIAVDARFSHALIQRALAECEDNSSALDALKKLISMRGNMLQLFLNVGGLLAAYQFGQVEAFRLLIEAISYKNFGWYDDLTNAALEAALCWHSSDPLSQQSIGHLAESALIKAVFFQDEALESLAWIMPLLVVRPNLIELRNIKNGKSIFDHIFTNAERDLCLWLDKSNKYPLMRAALEGKISVCQKMLAKKEISRIEKFMVMRVAARYGNIPLMQLLQAIGFDLTEHNNLALKTAIHYQQVEMICYLLRFEPVYQGVLLHFEETENLLTQSGFSESIAVLRLGWLGRPMIDCVKTVQTKMQEGLGEWRAWKKVFRERLEKKIITKSNQNLFCDSLFFLEKLYKNQPQLTIDFQAVLSCIDAALQEHLKTPLFPGFPRFATINFAEKNAMGIFKNWIFPVAVLQEKLWPQLPQALKEMLQAGKGFLEFEYQKPMNASVGPVSEPDFYFRYVFYLYYHTAQGERLKIAKWTLLSKGIVEAAHAGFRGLVDYFYNSPYDSEKAFARSKSLLRFLTITGDSEAVQLVFGLWYQWVALLGLNSIKTDYFVPSKTAMLPLYTKCVQKACELTSLADDFTTRVALVLEC